MLIFRRKRTYLLQKISPILESEIESQQDFRQYRQQARERPSRSAAPHRPTLSLATLVWRVAEYAERKKYKKNTAILADCGGNASTSKI
jgi:hypothetical protein